MRSFSFLVNPTSGGGAAPGAVVPVARALRDAGATVEVTYSPGPQAMKQLVSESVDRGDVVVSVGGDGMLSSIAGEVATCGGLLGVVPAGRGNDFARMLGIPSDPAGVARILLEATPTPTDLISAHLPGGPKMLASSVYAGVDALTTTFVDRAHWMPKKLQYPVSAVRALASFRAATYSVEIDGQQHEFVGATVVIANSGYYGSGMHIAPAASVDDGLLDIVVIEASGRLDMIRSFPKVYDGGHVELDQVHIFRGRSVTFSATPPVHLGGDGEALGLLGSDPLTVEVAPGAVAFLR